MCTLSGIGRVVRPSAIAMLLFSSSVIAMDIGDFDEHDVTLTKEKYRGREAIKVIEANVGNEAGNEPDTIAVLKSGLFHNGTIDLWLAGEPSSAAAAAAGARGFV